MKTFKRGDVVSVPDHILLEGIQAQHSMSQEDIAIQQYRVPTGRLCIVYRVNSSMVTVGVNFTDRTSNWSFRLCYVDVPIELLVQQGDDNTVKVSSLDYNSSDVLSDEDKLIIKGYMQNV